MNCSVAFERFCARRLDKKLKKISRGNERDVLDITLALCYVTERRRRVSTKCICKLIVYKGEKEREEEKKGERERERGGGGEGRERKHFDRIARALRSKILSTSTLTELCAQEDSHANVNAIRTVRIVVAAARSYNIASVHTQPHGQSIDDTFCRWRDCRNNYANVRIALRITYE